MANKKKTNAAEETVKTAAVPSGTAIAAAAQEAPAAVTEVSETVGKASTETAAEEKPAAEKPAAKKPGRPAAKSEDKPAKKNSEKPAKAADKPAAKTTKAADKPAAKSTKAADKPAKSTKAAAKTAKTPKASKAEKSVKAAKPAASDKAEEIFLELKNGSYDMGGFIEKCKADYKSKHPRSRINSIKIYIKPEDNKAYYVVNGNSGDDQFIDM